MGLFAPAWMSKNYKKALKAVENEANQSVLHQIATKASFMEIRAAAVKKMSDQAMIYDTIKHNKKNDVLNIFILAAIENMTDDKFLAEIVKDQPGYNTHVSLAAAKKMTNQKLAQIIYADLARQKSLLNDKRTPLEAVNLLTDRDFLEDAAINAVEPDVRAAAVKKLSDRVKI